MRALAFVSAAVACILSARAAGLNQLQVKKARLWTRMCPFSSFDDGYKQVQDDMLGMYAHLAMSEAEYDTR